MDMFDEHTKQLTIFKKYVLGREDAVDEAGDMIRRAGGVIDLADKELLRAIRKGKRDHTDGWVQWEDTFWKDNAGIIAKPPDSDSEEEEEEVAVHAAKKQAAPSPLLAAAATASTTSPELQ